MAIRRNQQFPSVHWVVLQIRNGQLNSIYGFGAEGTFNAKSIREDSQSDAAAAVISWTRKEEQSGVRFTVLNRPETGGGETWPFVTLFQFYGSGNLLRPFLPVNGDFMLRILAHILMVVNLAATVRL